MLIICVVAAYLLVPAMWQWDAASNHIDQVDTVTGLPPDPALLARLEAVPATPQSAPPILTYHNISPRPGQFTVSPQEFANQMRLLHDAGWQTATETTLSDWLAGAAWPPHTLMITFDDGARGVWQYADQILAKYDQHAIAYIITGFVGTHRPYYMTWPEITTLAQNGRWDMESHTDLGHGNVVIDAQGHQAPFLSSLEYLPAQRRLETPAEYQDRIGSDLRASKQAFADHGLPDPPFFAYPFSAHTTNGPATDLLLHTTVGSLFHAAMLDQSGDLVTTTSSDLASGELARMDITSDVGSASFVGRITGVSGLDPGTAAPFADPGNWATPDLVPAPLAVQNGVVSLDPGPGAYTAREYAHFQTSMWQRYTVSANLGPYLQGADTDTPGLVVFADDPQQVEVQLDAGSVQARVGDADARLVLSAALPAAASHHLQVDVRTDAVAISVDGRRIGSVPLQPAGPHQPAGGIAISASRQDANSAVPRFTNPQVH